MHGFQQVKQEVDTSMHSKALYTYCTYTNRQARAVPMLGYQWHIWLIVTMIRSSVLEESIIIISLARHYSMTLATI